MPIPWGLVVAATLLSAGTMALIWLAAVPWGPLVCPAVYPSPQNCLASHRAGTGVVATVVVVLTYLATLLSALLRTRRRRSLAVVGVALLGVAPVVAYLAVASAPGFVLT